MEVAQYSDLLSICYLLVELSQVNSSRVNMADSLLLQLPVTKVLFQIVLLVTNANVFNVIDLMGDDLNKDLFKEINTSVCPFIWSK